MSTLAFWVLVAYFVLAAVIVSLFVLFNRTAHEEALRAAATKSSASTQVGQCFTSVKNAPIVKGFIASHEAIIDNGLITNRAALQAERANDPLHNVRVHAIARLEKAKRNADGLRRLILANTPTRAACVKLARRLHVDPSRYLKGTK